MSDIILHHYPMSPFSEKMRAMLGYAGLSWQSVIHKEMPPRPQLARLAGGYRKIPVAQIGADIFCDTRTISSEIVALAGKQELALEHCADDIRAFVRKVDLDLFFPCVLVGAGKKLNRKALKSMSFLDLLRFIWDRINLGRKSAVKIPGAKQSYPLVKAHLEDLEQRLQQDFLFGDSPTVADFSTYHGLWFIRDMGEKSLIRDFPKINAWMDRIKAFGHGSTQEISAADAISIAAKATPRTIPREQQQDVRIGTQVSIAPDDYGQVPTTGKLVGCTPESWIIARQDPEAGTIHVHFPRQGFQLS